MFGETVTDMHSKLYNTDISQIIFQNLESGRINENKMTFRDVWYFHLEKFMFWEYSDLRKKSKIQTEDKLDDKCILKLGH